MKKSATARAKEASTNAGLATLANHLGFQAAQGYEMNDDEFDAVLCAVTGCMPDCTVHGDSLANVSRNKLVKLHGQADWIGKVEPLTATSSSTAFLPAFRFIFGGLTVRRLTRCLRRCACKEFRAASIRPQ